MEECQDGMGFGCYHLPSIFRNDHLICKILEAQPQLSIVQGDMQILLCAGEGGWSGGWTGPIQGRNTAHHHSAQSRRTTADVVQ